MRRSFGRFTEQCFIKHYSHSASELPPVSFYLVRLISKAPCMVLRLGFPIGTLAHTRNKVKVFSTLEFSSFGFCESCFQNSTVWGA